MLPEDPLGDLLSRDPHRIWAAAGAVMDLPDGAALEHLSGEIDRIISATKDVDLGGALMSNHVHLDLAIERLRLYRARVLDGPSQANCYCRMFAQARFMAPDQVARRSRGQIVSETVLNEEHSTVSKVRCTDGGAMWTCRDENGWHIPTCEWQEQTP